MTQKELLYLEDAVGHEKTIIKVCEDIVNNLEDEELKRFMEDEVSKHQTTYDNLMNILEVCSNE